MIRWFHRSKAEDGAAMVEFAITAPLLVMLLLYSIFFADFTFVKLKSLELARFVAWEKTVHRTDGEIRVDAEERFRNLRSSDRVDAAPNFLLGVALAEENPIEVEVAEVPVNLTGVVPDMDEDSFASGIMGTVGSVLEGLDDGLEAALGWFRFNTDGAVEATVRIRVVNNIVPDMLLHNIQTLNPEFQDPFVFESRHALVYDTWKAWPHPSSPLGGQFTNRNADPMDTYRIAERMTAEQVKQIAFVRLASVGAIDTVQGFLDRLNLPPPLDTRAAIDGGPITMLPGEMTTPASYSPSHRDHFGWQGSGARRGGQRLGHLYSEQPNPSWQPESPVPGVDRFRYSVPFKFNTPKWDDRPPPQCYSLPWGGEWCPDENMFGPFQFEGDGGYNHVALDGDDAESDYSRTWDCRGHFYDGRTDASGRYGQASNYSGCNGDEDDVDENDDGGAGNFGF
jgi:hypothetical protein